MPTTKRFHVRALLTVTTRRLLTQAKGPRDNGIGDLYELLGWMTGDIPMTHQLGRFGDECKPWLLRWFPELATIDDDDLGQLKSLTEIVGGPSGVEEWVDWIIGTRSLKTEYDVPKIPRDDHAKIDPYDELVQMRGTDEGIVIVNDGSAAQ